MAGKIIVSSVQSDTDNSISFVANTGATIFSANLSHGIAGSFIGDGSVTNAKLAGSITGNKIATGQITGNLLTANCVSGNNIVSSPTITGNVTINGSLGIGGATPASSGFGITFPATQSASTNANTLDDYEEGTWSPTIANGYTSPTYSFQAGTYTKIGRQVNFAFQLSVSGGTRTSGILQISLPFTPAASGDYRAFGAYWTYIDNGVFSSTTTNLPILYIANGNPNMQVYNSSGGSFLGTDLATATPVFYICGQFITD